MSEICVWREAGPLASAALRKDLLPHLLGTPSSPQGLSRCPLQPHQELIMILCNSFHCRSTLDTAL